MMPFFWTIRPYFAISPAMLLGKQEDAVSTFCKESDIDVVLSFCKNSKAIYCLFLARKTRWCNAFFFFEYQHSCMLWRMNVPKNSIEILSCAYPFYTFPRWRIFATDLSACCDRFISAGCENRMVADFVSVTVSSVAYFSGKAYHLLENHQIYLLKIAIQDKHPFVKTAPTYVLRTVDTDQIIKIEQPHDYDVFRALDNMETLEVF